jgi:hypothetical protein
MPAVQYSINTIRDEVRCLIDKGLVERHQPLYVICKFIPPREWQCVEYELEDHDLLLSDQVLDLVGREDWVND